MYTFIATISTTFLLTTHSFAKDCKSSLQLNLKNIRRGVYANQTVVFTSKSDGTVYTQVSNADGKVSFELPCEQTFTVKIDNYTHSMENKEKHSHHRGRYH